VSRYKCRVEKLMKWLRARPHVSNIANQTFRVNPTVHPGANSTPRGSETQVPYLANRDHAGEHASRGWKVAHDAILL